MKQLGSVNMKNQFVSILVKVYEKPNSLFIRLPIKLDNVKSQSPESPFEKSCDGRMLLEIILDGLDSPIRSNYECVITNNTLLTPFIQCIPISFDAHDSIENHLGYLIIWRIWILFQPTYSIGQVHIVLDNFPGYNMTILEG